MAEGREAKAIRRTILLTERKDDMVEQIARELGIFTFTAVIENAIDLYHKKTFPSYVVRQSGEGQKETTNLTPSEIAANKVESKELVKKAEQNRKDSEKSLICTRELFGKVIDDGNGNKYCVFPTHTPNASGELKVPLMQASPIIAKTSIFMPSKEVVLKARPDLKKIYGKK